jgi:predicted nucleic acid-binding Zn ribbon protein
MEEMRRRQKREMIILTSIVAFVVFYAVTALLPREFV